MFTARSTITYNCSCFMHIPWPPGFNLSCFGADSTFDHAERNQKKNHAWRFNMFENYSINIRCLRRATIQFDDRIKLDNTRFVSRESSEYSHNPSALQLTSRLQRCLRREAYTGKYPCPAGYSSGGITPIIGRDLKGSFFFFA